MGSRTNRKAILGTRLLVILAGPRRVLVVIVSSSLQTKVSVRIAFSDSGGQIACTTTG
jgi:hypothetical protein